VRDAGDEIHLQLRESPRSLTGSDDHRHRYRQNQEYPKVDGQIASVRRADCGLNGTFVMPRNDLPVALGGTIMNGLDSQRTLIVKARKRLRRTVSRGFRGSGVLGDN